MENTALESEKNRLQGKINKFLQLDDNNQESGSGSLDDGEEI